MLFLLLFISFYRLPCFVFFEPPLFCFFLCLSQTAHTYIPPLEIEHRAEQIGTAVSFPDFIQLQTAWRSSFLLFFFFFSSAFSFLLSHLHSFANQPTRTRKLEALQNTPVGFSSPLRLSFPLQCFLSSFLSLFILSFEISSSFFITHILHYIYWKDRRFLSPARYCALTLITAGPVHRFFLLESIFLDSAIFNFIFTCLYLATLLCHPKIFASLLIRRTPLDFYLLYHLFIFILYLFYYASPESRRSVRPCAGCPLCWKSDEARTFVQMQGYTNDTHETCLVRCTLPFLWDAATIYFYYKTHNGGNRGAGLFDSWENETIFITYFVNTYAPP